jgi:hypothetical protein
LSSGVLAELEEFLEDSYLYDKSNLERLNVRFDGEINVKLKSKSIYNPLDTRQLYENFTKKYFESVDTLAFIFYPLRTMDIKFYIEQYEEYGYAFYYSNGKNVENYGKIREAILKSEQKEKVEERRQQQEEKLAQKHKQLAGKAFGFVNFGETVEQVRIKLEEDPRVRINKIMVDNPTYEVVMGSFKYKMKPIYKNGVLYLMNFVSDGFWPNQYKKDLKQTWKDIVDYYSQIHGEVESEFVDSESIEEDLVHWTAEWQLDKKKIQVGISRNKGQFFVVIWISHEDFPLE